MYKIIGADQKEYGPVSADQLRQWVAQGRAGRQTRVQAEGATDWKPLSEFADFADAFNAASTPAMPPPLSAPPPVAAKTSGMAITSLVLGVLGVISCGLTSLVGLVLGIVALKNINRSQGQLSGSGLAIAGICVSGAFLLLIPILASLLLPALSKAKSKAQTIKCVSNLRQISLAGRLWPKTTPELFRQTSNP